MALVAVAVAAAMLTAGALPAEALERITSPVVEPERNNASCFATATVPRSPDGSSQSSGVRPVIRVALNMSSAKIALSCPDGATIHNNSSGALVAQLPPRSTWDVCRRQLSNTSQLCFSGSIGNCAFNRVVVDRTLNTASSPFRSAAFQKSNGTGFQPQILDGAAPEFSLNLRVGSGTAVQDGEVSSFRAIAFSSAETGGQSAGSVSTEPPVCLIITPTRSDGLIGVNNKLYRGRIELRANASTPQLAVINVVPMEDYLLSVVPAEMPGSWPLESLKAQAIAARSYAVANIGKHAAEGYDVDSTVNDQVYGGVEPETENSNLAVAQTEGLVLKHQDKVVSAFFHSAGGGCTELAEHVWGRPVPYLKSVADYDDRSPHFSWTRQFPVSAADECLKKSGKDVGMLLSVMPLVRSASGRLKSAMLIGTNGPVIVSGEELRRIFSLPSSLFNACIDNDCYVFAGRGFGHGLGMSQWGAKSLAEQGYNAAQILSYYYKEVSIDQL